jgi:hypothetical protein
VVAISLSLNSTVREHSVLANNRYTLRRFGIKSADSPSLNPPK